MGSLRGSCGVCFPRGFAIEDKNSKMAHKQLATRIHTLYIVLYCIVLYCIVLHCIAFIVSYRIVLYRISLYMFAT